MKECLVLLPSKLLKDKLNRIQKKIMYKNNKISAKNKAYYKKIHHKINKNKKKNPT